MNALAYVVRRAAIGALILFALANITFWADRAIPYEPALHLLGDVQHPTDAQLAEAAHLLGTDRPALVQYGRFLEGLATGDLGVSWSSARRDAERRLVADPVGPMLVDAAGVTGSLVLGGGLLVLLLAVPGGIWLAERAGSWADRSATLLVLAALSTHPLVLGNLLRLLFADRLGWLPEGVYCPLRGTLAPSEPLSGVPTAHCGGPVDWMTHLVLPWISFAALLGALHLRQMRAASIAVLGEPFVVVARAKGLRRAALLRRHVLPNALPTVIAGLAADVSAILGVALYVEVVFGLPGLGRLFLVAVGGSVAFDRPVLIGVVLVVGAVVVAANLVADLLIALLDPRVPLTGERPASTTHD